MTFSQNAESTGLSCANTASSAPTIVLSRPCSASTGVRASGASTNSARFAPKSIRIAAVEAGSAVDVSTTIKPSRAAVSSPVPP